jgi:acetyl-CoA carboxylase carboxyl transferase subunit alpha
MAMNFLEFEQPIAELEAKIEELRFLGTDASVNISEEVKRLQSKSRALTTSIFANLSPWQITQLARHPQRPYTLDYVSMIFTDWHELHGDRMYSDDLAIVGGLARLERMPVMVIGQQKGRDTKERVRRNYGMPKPEGYRKALRLMRIRPARIRVSARRSGDRVRRSRAICSKCRTLQRRYSPSSSAKAARAVLSRSAYATVS